MYMKYVEYKVYISGYIASKNVNSIRYIKGILLD